MEKGRNQLLAFPLATRKSTLCVNESILLQIGRVKEIAKKLKGILIEVNGGVVSYVQISGDRVTTILGAIIVSFAVSALIADATGLAGAAKNCKLSIVSGFIPNALRSEGSKSSISSISDSATFSSAIGKLQSLNGLRQSGMVTAPFFH
jgi:hypothetical protein